MFTGIISAVGKIIAIKTNAQDCQLTVNSGALDLATAALGDSIAINGICLTIISKPNNTEFIADVSTETLSKTSLKNIQTNSLLNLELPLTLSSRLGGHLVSGHVDGVGVIVSKKSSGNSTVFGIKAPDNLAKYIATKGSVTVDGVSLTVNLVDGNVFYLNIIPHTIDNTISKYYQLSSIVNLEVDLMARYLERLMLGDDAAKANGITTDFLQTHGYI